MAGMAKMMERQNQVVAALAEDHWTMAVLFQRLSEGLADGLDQDVLVRILDALVTFFADHAVREEAHLAQIRHADLGRHRDEHAEALAYLHSVLNQCRAGLPLTRSQISAISEIFTETLFASDRRDGLSR